MRGGVVKLGYIVSILGHIVGIHAEVQSKLCKVLSRQVISLTQIQLFFVSKPVECYQSQVMFT